MTLAELQHIFRFQLTADADFTPLDTVNYLLLDGQNRIPGLQDAHDLEPLITLLEGYVFEGYRDRMPLFLKPEE
jgi:hypothetical protein